MDDKFIIFEARFNNEELENEFHNFFHKYNLTPLFTNEHRSTGISVSYLDAKSVVNPTGSYHNTLKSFADVLNLANDNKSYEEALFKIIYEARSFQGLINIIRRVMQYIETVNENHMFNIWNIVFYTKEVF